MSFSKAVKQPCKDIHVVRRGFALSCLLLRRRQYAGAWQFTPWCVPLHCAMSYTAAKCAVNPMSHWRVADLRDIIHIMQMDTLCCKYCVVFIVAGT
eukprot:2717979-Amphidinium_carterae.1